MARIVPASRVARGAAADDDPAALRSGTERVAVRYRRTMVRAAIRCRLPALSDVASLPAHVGPGARMHVRRRPIVMAIQQTPRVINPWHVAQQQFDRAADRLELDPGLREVLREPRREFMIHFPVKMDDGSVRVFKGYRVHHNLTRAPPRVASATTRTSTSTRSRPSRCG